MKSISLQFFSINYSFYFIIFTHYHFIKIAFVIHDLKVRVNIYKTAIKELN